MRIKLAIPDRHVTAGVIDAALEATTRAAQSQMQSGDAPTFSDMMRDGVRWRPESYSDGEHFDLPSVVGQRGWGDCDDLAPALAAEIRQYDPGARAIAVRSGPNRWHCIVQLTDGTLIDPSQIAGMRRRQGIPPAVSRPMGYPGETIIGIASHRGDWVVRTDVPWADAHLSSLARHRDLDRAFADSISGAVTVGLCTSGWPSEEHAHVVGQISSLLGAAFPGAGIATGLLGGLLGGGGGAAAPAAAPGGGGGAPAGGQQSPQQIAIPGGGKCISVPGGPVIVKF